LKKSKIEFYKKIKDAHGGELMKTRHGRSRPRPLSARHSMHLVLRSSKARGEWSFRKKGNPQKINVLVQKFSKRYGVKVISLANVGNHLHFHLKLSDCETYPAFIRALTASIAMAVTGASRWKPFKNCLQEVSSDINSKASQKFWDYRPFTRFVKGVRAFLKMQDYIEINQLEGIGYRKREAEMFLAHHRDRAWGRAVRAGPRRFSGGI